MTRAASAALFFCVGNRARRAFARRWRWAPWGIVLTPAFGAVLMSASTVIVAINARLLGRIISGAALEE